jgi:hypothetical protein
MIAILLELFFWISEPGFKNYLFFAFIICIESFLVKKGSSYKSFLIIIYGSIIPIIQTLLWTAVVKAVYSPGFELVGVVFFPVVFIIILYGGIILLPVCLEITSSILKHKE